MVLDEGGATTVLRDMDILVKVAPSVADDLQVWRMNSKPEIVSFWLSDLGLQVCSSYLSVP